MNRTIVWTNAANIRLADTTVRTLKALGGNATPEEILAAIDAQLDANGLTRYGITLAGVKRSMRYVGMTPMTAGSNRYVLNRKDVAYIG